MRNRGWLWIVVPAAVAVAGYAGWRELNQQDMPVGIVMTNGRLESEEVLIATKLADGAMPFRAETARAYVTPT